jgi:hypothetical protein
MKRLAQQLGKKGVLLEFATAPHRLPTTATVQVCFARQLLS